MNENFFGLNTWALSLFPFRFFALFFFSLKMLTFISVCLELVYIILKLILFRRKRERERQLTIVGASNPFYINLWRIQIEWERGREICCLFTVFFIIIFECINKWQTASVGETERTLHNDFWYDSWVRLDDFMLKCHIHAKCITPKSVQCMWVTGWFSSCKILKLYMRYRCHCHRSTFYSHFSKIPFCLLSPFILFLVLLLQLLLLPYFAPHRNTPPIWKNSIVRAMLVIYSTKSGLLLLWNTNTKSWKKKHFLNAIFRRKS